MCILDDSGFIWACTHPSFTCSCYPPILLDPDQTLSPSGKLLDTHTQTGSQALFHIQKVPDLRWFNLWFFNFTMVQKRCAFRRNQTWNFEFCFFSRLVIWGTTPSRDDGRASSHSSRPATRSPGQTPYPLTTIVYPDNRSVSHFQ